MAARLISHFPLTFSEVNESDVSRGDPLCPKDHTHNMFGRFHQLFKCVCVYEGVCTFIRSKINLSTRQTQRDSEDNQVKQRGNAAARICGRLMSFPKWKKSEGIKCTCGESESKKGETERNIKKKNDLRRHSFLHLSLSLSLNEWPPTRSDWRKWNRERNGEDGRVWLKVIQRCRTIWSTQLQLSEGWTEQLQQTKVNRQSDCKQFTKFT